MGIGGVKWQAVVAGVVIAATSGAVGWYAGSSSEPRDASNGSDTRSAVTNASMSADKLPPGVTPLPNPPVLPKPAPVSSEQAKTFSVLQCGIRQFNGTLALAVTFSQPVSRQADLRQWIGVHDAGRVDTDPEAQENSEQTDVQAKSGSVDEKLRQSSRVIAGSWTVGDDARVIYFPYVQPSRRYMLQFDKGLAGGDNKAEISAASHCDVPTNVMPAAFYFASKGVVLPAGQNGGLPVATVNTSEVDVQFLRIEPDRVPEFFSSILGVPAPRQVADESQVSDDEDEYSSDDDDYYDNRSLKGLVGIYDLDRLRRLSTSVFQGRFMTDPTPDRRNVTFLPVERIDALKAPGIYVAVMTQPGRFQYESQVTYFYVSDIGLHARRNDNTIDAFMVSLTTGKPLKDVQSELVDATGRVVARSKADASGHVRFEGQYDTARVLRAIRGNEITVLALGEPALDLSEFDVGGLPSTENKLFVYAGRNLYRPGETFSVSVLARDPDGKAGMSVPITATIKRVDGRTVSTALWQPTDGAPGYTQKQIVLPADAQTGQWRLELRVNPAQRRPDSAWTFQVEEFLPERMKLTLDAPDPVTDSEGGFSVDVQGDYLYGAPAAGNRLLATLQIKRDRQPLARQWPGFVFGDVADDDKKSFRELEEQTLDEQGKGAIELDPDLDNARSPMMLRVSASLLESGGRPIVRSIERSIWPADVLIGVRPLFENDVTRQGAPANFEVIRVNRKGEQVAAKNITLKLFKETREYYWRFDDQRGWNSGYNESESLIETRTLNLSAPRVALSVPVNWGRYRMEVSDPETGQTMRYRFYAGWDAQDAETLGNRPDRVQMQLNGTPAKPGDTLKLKLTPPHDGQALVTVEGGGLLWSKWVDAKAEGTEVDIPLDPSWKRQDLYVAAVVFRPGNQGDQVTPARAVGMAYIPMANDQRRLDVTLQAPDKVLPDTTAQAKITVKGAQAGQSAYLTVSAVDVGILNINNYLTPDPFGFFFGKHRYAPELLDMYGKLIEKMPGASGRLRWGGDADQRSDSRSLPKKVKLVDVFSGLVKLDANGQASIPLAIPDFNGTLRIMAVAFDEQRYGNAAREMQVAAPIVAELSTPRFITTGDQAAIALDITNMSGHSREVHIDLQSDSPLRIADGVRTVTLADKQRTILRFVATGTGGYGAGLIRLGVDAPAITEAGGKAIPAYKTTRESILQVQAPYAPTRRVQQVRIAPGETFTVPDEWTAGYIPKTTSMSMALSSSLPFDVPKLVQDLLSYPYGCTEQTISATMPWLLLDARTAEQFKLKVKGDLEQERQLKVSGAVSRLAGMRGSSGGYSLWGGGDRDVWITSYALSFLQTARANGFSVADRDLDVPRQWLLSTLQRSHDSFGTWSAELQAQVSQGTVSTSGATVLRNDHQRFAGFAIAARILAQDGRAPLSSVRTLFDKYANRARSPLPLVDLAVAFKLMGDMPRADRAAQMALTREYGIGRRDRGSSEQWLGDYGSGLRDLAMAYALLVEHDLAPQRREALLPLLASRISSRTYFSTQEQLAMILAARATGAAEKPWQIQLDAGQTPRTLGGRDTETVPLVPEGAPTTIVNTGDTPVFASFDIQGTNLRAPVPDRRVVDIQRTWYRPDGRAWDGGVLRTGDMIVVRLRAKSRALMPDALIVDQVPAGMEVENLNLSQGPGMADWKIGGVVVAQAMQDSRIQHTEFRDDRYVAAATLGQGDLDVFYLLRVVTPGRFAVPAPTVEAMYRPELRATGDTWRDIEIRDRDGSKP